MSANKKVVSSKVKNNIKNDNICLYNEKLAENTNVNTDMASKNATENEDNKDI